MTEAQIQWIKHALGSLIAGGAIYGLIEAFVPAGYKAEAYSLVPTIAYMVGVRAPTPAGK